MRNFTQRRDADFIISEAPGQLSRDNGVVQQGVSLRPGEVVAFDGDELVAWESGASAGIMLYAVDASARAKPCSILARAAEVNPHMLVYSGEEADVIAALAARNIITHVAANIGGAPAWLPEGALAFLDAANEHYWDGAETTLAAMISGITRDGDGLITASGGFTAIGDFAAALAWPCTVVVAANDMSLSVLDCTTADPLAYAFLGMHNANGTTDDFDTNYLQVTGIDTNANRKIAATFSASKIAISVEGETVVMDDSATVSMPAFTSIKVASFADDTGRISQIIVFPSQADAALPALSTV